MKRLQALKTRLAGDHVNFWKQVRHDSVKSGPKAVEGGSFLVTANKAPVVWRSHLENFLSTCIGLSIQTARQPLGQLELFVRGFLIASHMTAECHLSTMTYHF